MTYFSNVPVWKIRLTLHNTRSSIPRDNSLIITQYIRKFFSGSVNDLQDAKLWLPVLLTLLVCMTGCEKSAQSEAPQEHPGKEIYRKYCLACHQGGVAGSPTFGDKEAWEPLLEKGREALIQSVIDGIPPAMPIKGLCMSCSDEELADAVDYMLVPILEPAEENASIEPTTQKGSQRY